MRLKDYIRQEICPGETNWLKIRAKLRLNMSCRAVYLIRKKLILDRKIEARGGIFLKLRRKLLENKLHKEFGIYVGHGAQIGIGLYLPHPMGIVIGAYARIGENCRINQQVTIANHKNPAVSHSMNLIKVGNNCVFYGGAKIIGDITVDDDVTVGVNAVLTKNATSGVWAGVPAKKLEKTKGDMV